MRKMLYVVLAFFVLVIPVSGVSWAQYDDHISSMESGTLEEGRQEMGEMDYQMETQPDDGRMDVQPNDAIDSEFTGAH